MKIALDAFGGDFAPYSNIEGAIAARKEYGVEVALVGKMETVKAAAAEKGFDLSGVELVDAEDVFDMHRTPTDLIKEGKNTSLAVAMQLCADGKADAVVSAGSTGAIVVGGTFLCKRIKGVKRAALGSVLPTEKGQVFMMDIGANADCRPEMVQQFGVMASAYLNKVCGIEDPTVGLLNIGTEETKGGEAQLEAYRLLSKAPIHFVGNVESRELPGNSPDAVVTDGFTGNIALKLYEGVADHLFSLIKAAFKTNLKTKIAGVLVKPSLKGLKKKFDASEIGGAPLLGVRVPVIKAHGNSNAKAVKNAIRQAKAAVENDLCGAIAEGMAVLNQSEEKEEPSC